MAPPAKKLAKPIFKTQNPYTETTWSNISSEDHDVILDLLCDLLEPLGHHRRTHKTPSKGKRHSKKRKRTAATAQHDDEDGMLNTTNEPDLEDRHPTPPPLLSSHLMVGLNSITRHLSILAAPSTLPLNQNGDGEKNENKSEGPTPLTLLFIPHANPSNSLAHAHLPTLTYLASKSHPTLPPTRLVALSSSSEAKLASALHIPRVGALALLQDAPGATALVEYVRERAGGVECKWIEEGLKAEWKGLKVSISTK